MNRHGPVVVARRQRGATAVEFVFVFPVLFLILYATLVYSYVFVLQQAITYTAQNLAETVVAVDPSPTSSYNTRIRSRVQAIADEQLKWLPADQRARVLGEQGVALEFPPIGGGAQVVVVTLNFDLAGLFPGLGPVLPLPPSLVAKATARIS